MISDLQILQHTQKLLAKGWAQHAFARDCWDNDIPTTARAACKFCITGAVYRVVWEADDSSESQVNQLLRVFSKIERYMPPNTSISIWNDMKERTQEEVLALFSMLIQTEQEAR
jgi:hypothetical protein